jgi:valyl-tRNA synthetase
VDWFRARLSQAIEQVEDHYSKFRISDALMTIYKLFWDDYCSTYLEAIKPAFGQPIDTKTQAATLEYFEALLKLIHPVMPFITEELWQDIAERKEGETILFAPSPKAESYDASVLEDFALAMEAVNGVRAVRNQKNIGPKETLHLIIKAAGFPCIPVIEKMALAQVELATAIESAQGVGFMVRTTELFVKLEGLVNLAEELEKAKKDLAYYEQFLKGVRAKLSNEKFTAHAPEAVVQMERKKEADALSKIESLDAKIKQLS